MCDGVMTNLLVFIKKKPKTEKNIISANYSKGFTAALIHISINV